MSVPFNPITAVLLIPIVSAALLAIMPGYRLTARLNVVASSGDVSLGADAVSDRASAARGPMC